MMDNQLLITNSPAGDINPGPGSSNPSGFSAATFAAGTPSVTYKMVVFAADDGTHGRELWGTSGTGPTALVADMNTTSPTASSDPQQFTAVNVSGTDVKSFFTADNGVNGRELWRTDGTTAGTGMCKDIVAGAASSDPADLTAVTLLNGLMNNPTLFFTVDSDGSGTRELWKSNGRLDGTDTLQVFDPGTAGSVGQLIAANKLNLLFFAAGNALYKSDGTTALTTVVKSFAALPGPIVTNVGGSVLYFVADDGAGAGLELWTASMVSGVMEVKLVKDIVAGSGTASPQNLCAVGDTIYFTANDGTHGRELWRTDANATVGAPDGQGYQSRPRQLGPGKADRVQRQRAFHRRRRHPRAGTVAERWLPGANPQRRELQVGRCLAHRRQDWRSDPQHCRRDRRQTAVHLLAV
jgi:ELWxxDGT repeat protein